MHLAPEENANYEPTLAGSLSRTGGEARVRVLGEARPAIRLTSGGLVQRRAGALPPPGSSASGWCSRAGTLLALSSVPGAVLGFLTDPDRARARARAEAALWRQGTANGLVDSRRLARLPRVRERLLAQPVPHGSTVAFVLRSLVGRQRHAEGMPQRRRRRPQPHGAGRVRRQPEGGEGFQGPSDARPIAQRSPDLQALDV